MGLLWISQKDRLFLFLITTICSHYTSPLFAHSTEKVFIYPLVLPRRGYPWTIIWKRSILICFWNCQDVPYSNSQSRKRMMNTFMMVNITPICKKCFLYFPPPKMTFLPFSVEPRREYTWALKLELPEYSLLRQTEKNGDG